VLQLRANYTTSACPIPTYLGPTAYAFLAPSLREALAHSPFASRTRVVPGEADDSCAVHAKVVSRSIIFTSDTDLLLFDYHAETLVVLFQDAESPVGLRAISPSETAKKMQLKSLVPFAYAIQQRSSEGQDDLIRDAKNIDTDSPMYLSFSQRYKACIVAPSYLEKHCSLPPSLQELDVRVYEFVHEALTGSSELPVHLPLLVEDANQASAWNMAQDVRTLAYSLLAPPTSTVQEFKRKAQGISPQQISTYSAPDIQTPAKDLEAQLSAVLKWSESKDISPSLLWALFALSIVLAEVNIPPPLALVMRVLNGDFDNTWAFVQFMARLQATAYSLRMLKQVTAVWLAINQQSKSKLHESLSSLQAQMSTFSTIAEIFIVPGQTKRVLAEHDVMRALVEEIYASAGVEVPTEQVSNKKKKRQAREADRKKRKFETRQQSTASVTNSYAALRSV
jgi:hypothetical protein